jgi:aspartyl-tRNA(Asn)/glutamyl-tRNA(Gln) amidotransferase subunit B
VAQKYETVIGLEIHAQLPTNTKLFCGCAIDFGQEPNKSVCPVCLGLPGALPVINGQAVRYAVRAALALGLTIAETSIFARKNYFYPDLPKGYQISQFERPYSENGVLEFEVGGEKKRASIIRIHMEEDAGKNIHGQFGDSIVDLNRAGTPLIEIVGAPDLRSSAEAAAYMKSLREILLFLGVNDGNMEEGSFRCDVNISIRPFGAAEYGTRVELKNINSFRFVQKAIDGEVQRQIQLVEGGGRVVQETRGYDAENNRTYSLRSKEDAHDYRYFPDPDLPPLKIPASLLEEERANLPALPNEIRAAMISEGLPESAAITLTSHPKVAAFVAEAKALIAPELFKKLANFVQTEVLRGATTSGLEANFTVTPRQVSELVGLVEAGKISGKQAKEVFAMLEGTDKLPSEIVAERGMVVVSDTSALEAMLVKLIAENPKQADGIRAGRKQLAGFFVGQVMKETQGSADPKVVSELLERLIGA